MAIEMTPNGTYGATRSPGTLANSVLKRFAGLLVGLYRLLGGRGMRALGAPLLLLTTVGARSGKARVTPVAWFPDGSDSWLVVASAAGAARSPGVLRQHGQKARSSLDRGWTPQTEGPARVALRRATRRGVAAHRIPIAWVPGLPGQDGPSDSRDTAHTSGRYTRRRAQS